MAKWNTAGKKKYHFRDVYSWNCNEGVSRPVKLVAEVQNTDIHLKEEWVSVCIRLTKQKKKHIMFREFPETKIAGSWRLLKGSVNYTCPVLILPSACAFVCTKRLASERGIWGICPRQRWYVYVLNIVVLTDVQQKIQISPQRVDTSSTINIATINEIK